MKTQQDLATRKDARAQVRLRHFDSELTPTHLSGQPGYTKISNELLASPGFFSSTAKLIGVFNRFMPTGAKLHLSLKQLAKFSGLSRRTVIYELKLLEGKPARGNSTIPYRVQEGLIERTTQGGGRSKETGTGIANEWRWKPTGIRLTGRFVGTSHSSQGWALPPPAPPPKRPERKGAPSPFKGVRNASRECQWTARRCADKARALLAQLAGRNDRVYLATLAAFSDVGDKKGATVAPQNVKNKTKAFDFEKHEGIASPSEGTDTPILSDGEREDCSSPSTPALRFARLVARPQKNPISPNALKRPTIDAEPLPWQSLCDAEKTAQIVAAELEQGAAYVARTRFKRDAWDFVGGLSAVLSDVADVADDGTRVQPPDGPEV